MSYKLVNAIFRIGLPRAEKQVLQALASHAHDDGSGAWPSINTLMHFTGLSERGVRDALRALEERDYIVAETDKTGGNPTQTVRYRIFNPKLCADIVAAVEAKWKHTGAVVAPVKDDGGSECPPTGAMVAPTGAVTAETGAVSAPESVLEAVPNQPIQPTQPTQPPGRDGCGMGLLGSKSAGKATPRADWAIEKFVLSTEHAMPASNKVKAEIEALFANVPKEVAEEALTRWSDGREAGFKRLKDPARAMLNELPPFIKLVEQEVAPRRK